jgi:hypothetical protein
MTETFTLKAGTVVHVCGLPVALTEDVVIETHPLTWEQISTDLVKAGIASEAESQKD